MFLTTACQNCQNLIQLRTFSTDRADLAKTKGEEVQLPCKQCNAAYYYHVNNIYAKEGKHAPIIAFTILIVGTGVLALWSKDFLLYSFNPKLVAAIGGLLFVPSFVYTVLLRQERDRVNRFNQFYI